MVRHSNLVEFDPNASDPNDSDFDDAARSSPKRRPKKKSSRSSGAHRTPQKKRSRRRFGDGSDSDIVDDEDDISEEEFTASSEEEFEVNEKTGRAVRSAAKKQITYEESDEDEEPEFVADTAESEQEEEEEVHKTLISPKKRAIKAEPVASTSPRQIVKLKFNNWEAISSSARATPATMPATRRRPGSRATSHVPPTPFGTRKSSRLSREPEAALQELSASGRHAVTVGSSNPATPIEDDDNDDDEPPLASRRTRGSKAPTGGKQPVKAPSIVMEESQSYEHEHEHGHGHEEEPSHDVVTSVEIMEEIEVEGDVAADEEVADELAEGPEQVDSDDEEDVPIKKGGIIRRAAAKEPEPSPAKRKRAQDESSDFNPDDDGEAEEEDDEPPNKRTRQQSSSQSQKSGRRTRHSQRIASESEDSDIDPEELDDEVRALRKEKPGGRYSRRLRVSQKYDAGQINFGEETSHSQRVSRNVPRKDYTIPTMEKLFQQDDAAFNNASEHEPTRNNRKQKKTAPKKSGSGGNLLHTTRGPFGGYTADGEALLEEDFRVVVLEEPESSDDEDIQQQLKTPAIHDRSGNPAEFGKINKDKKAAAADIDPLGVDENVKFDAVGGLDGHIDSLKEMVLHPLMYPEVIQKFGVQPPRGVLFHGPPGTGKTLLARALSNSIESGGKKVTFFMRKGADALSKWVGEAERQLRLLFEEAQKCQPSIIFFDEIDGLAPVRSGKSEQIHASIVATLLALMDGMDNRGQVVVIGATNRPDNVDPALRRPGRFDREFFFPLPDQVARRAIIDINTKKWDPPLSPAFIDQLAELTTGYGGADIRALCTEAALNAIQGTYPQIYKSNKKLELDPSKIKVNAKDFMISIDKIVPSSLRVNNNNSEPLAKGVEPLLREPLKRISEIVNNILPRRPKLTALQEAEFDDREDNAGFERHNLQRDVDRARVFRPRLLIRGLRGNGQQELSAALLHTLEGLFVQSFDMATLLQDSSISPEAVVARYFKEIRSRKPSVIFIPDVDEWYMGAGENVVKIFLQQLRAVPANDPVLLIGMMSTDTPDEQPDPRMLRDLFGFSSRSDYQIERPSASARYEYFEALVGLARKRPSEFPDPGNRKRRKLEELPEAKENAQVGVNREKAQRKLQYQEDCHALNLLKQSMLPTVTAIKDAANKIFHKPIIDPSSLRYLWDDDDQATLTSDLTEEQRQQLQYRPYVKDKDEHGRRGLREVATGKFYYNMDVEDLRCRTLNGYYCRWKDLVDDVMTLYQDAKTRDDSDRIQYGQEILTNVRIDAQRWRTENPQLDQQLAAMHVRFSRARQERIEKAEREKDLPIGTTTNQAPILNAPPDPTSRRPVTPTPGSQHLSNGDGIVHLTNGSTVPSQPNDGDIRMEDAPPPPAANTMAAPPLTHSQRSALEKMAPSSQVEDYHNSASTTTSGQNQSNRTSGAAQHPHGFHMSAHTPAGFPAAHLGADHGPVTPSRPPGILQKHGASGDGGTTQSHGTSITNQTPGDPKDNSNGTESRHFPNWDSEHPIGGSQLPDTQPNSEGQNSLPKTNGSAHSSGHGVSQIANLLNPQPTMSKDAEQEPEPELIISDREMTDFHELLARDTSGMSVEQIVQINAALTNELINHRKEWNKGIVLLALKRVFAQTRNDIVELQRMYDASFE